MTTQTSPGAALAAIRWAKATKEERLAEGRRLNEAKRKARKKKLRKKKSKVT